MKIVELSVKRPVGVIMIVIGLLVLGMISLKNLAIDLFPKMNVPVAVVTTTYQGASPQEIEKLVSEPLESAVGSIQGVDTIQSVSSPNSSLVVLQFDWGTDIESALNDIRERIDQVEGILPEDADSPSVMRLDPQQTPVLWVGLSGKSPEQLQNIAEDTVQPAFERVDGVASVSIQGGKQREIRVEINQALLNNYGLTADQIANALRVENQAVSAGVLRKGSQELQVRVDGEFTSIEDIEKTPIQLQDGRTITVGDVANINDTFKDALTLSEVNQKPALVLSILKQSDGNTVEVADGMYEEIDELNQELKKSDVELSVIMDTSTFIRQSISSVVDNMITGAVLSVIVLLLFLRSFRSTLVIGVSIPIAIISTFTLMYFTGETLNVLSMGGLALGIGMMVDNSIVILEHIYDLRQKGMPLKEAAIKGGKELASAIIASTMTTVVVFAPIVFVEGLAGELFRPLAMTVTFSLLLSLITALTIVPMLSSKLLTKQVKMPEDIEVEEGKKGRLKRFAQAIVSRYKRFLEWALGHRKTVLFGTLLLVVASLGLTPFIGATFLPESDQGQLSMAIEIREGAELEETKAVIEDIDEKLKKYKDTIDIGYVTIGGGSSGFGASSSNTAEYIIQLVDSEQRSLSTTQVIKGIEKELKDIPGAKITVSSMESGMQTGSPIDIKISGPELDVLEDLSQQVVWMLEDIEGTNNIESSVAESRPQMEVEVKRDLVHQYGLSYQQVMNAVKTAFDGQTATRYREDGSEYDVRVLLPEEERESIRDLESMFIRTNDGIEVPLSTVAELKQTQGPAEINRENQQRQVSVTSDVRDRDLGSVNADITASIEQLYLPEGYTVSLGGQTEEMMESFTSLGLALVLSIFLVYLVMAVQFESLAYPFVVMFSLPTTVVGVLIGLAVTQKPLSVPAFIGLIMLAGIVVNNAIVLVDYINLQRSKGMGRREAVIDAGLSRLRPIFMTTLTTVLAMVPLALEIGEGAESQSPMAVVIIFGLLTSTIFTLVVIPVVYTLIDDMTNKFKNKKFKRIKFRRKNKEIEA